jgi:hypothetical protein
MSDTEMKELDAWIHKHVMEGDLYVGLKKRGLWYRPNARGYTDRQSEAGRYTRAEAKEHEYPHDEPVTICEFKPENYSSDAAAAMEVLKKCSDIAVIDVGQSVGKWFAANQDFFEWAQTLELAICLFAKKLFSKS